jgi:hypothetical protein
VRKEPEPLTELLDQEFPPDRPYRTRTHHQNSRKMARTKPQRIRKSSQISSQEMRRKCRTDDNNKRLRLLRRRPPKRNRPTKIPLAHLKPHLFYHSSRFKSCAHLLSLVRAQFWKTQNDNWHAAQDSKTPKTPYRSLYVLLPAVKF